MVHIGTSSLASKASKARNVVKKNTKTGKDSKMPPEDLREPLPSFIPGNQARLATISFEKKDPWGNSISTGVVGNPEDHHMRRAWTDGDNDRIPERISSLEHGGIRPRKAVPEPAEHSCACPDDKEPQGEEDLIADLTEDQDADSETLGEDQQPSQAAHEDEWKQKLLEAQGTERQLLAKVQQLEAQLQQQSQRCIELDRAWKKSTALLTQLQRQDPHDKVDDSTLQGLYNGLVFDVANWAASFCRGGAMRIIDTKRPLLQSLGPAYASYYHDETLRPFLLQSLLMRLLVREVLNFDCDGGLWWAGMLCKPLRRIQTELMPVELFANPESIKAPELAEIREYARWKAKGALIMGKRANRLAVNTGIDRVVSKFKQDLYMYVPASNAEVWTELREIVTKAVKLDEEMNKSRALLTVSHWDEEDFKVMKFDETMESAVGFAAARPGMAVELVLAPALVKMGTADGESYDKISYLSKWKVICSESRKR